MVARPFLKWAGGKGKLATAIESRIPSHFSKGEFSYVEPFVGAGAMFFWMKNRFDNLGETVINDVNSDLINCYRVVKFDVEALIEQLSFLQSQYGAFGDDEGAKALLYYSVRDAFNLKATPDIERAAQMIFLNKTCFNGLYRVNKKGAFNVPIGRYKNPNICDSENLRKVSKVLVNTIILNGDYSETKKYSSVDTLYYLDPPYKPLTTTSSFNAYAKNGFGDDEQIRLAEFCHEINELKSTWILSNSDVDLKTAPNKFFDELYNNFDIQRVKASRAINSASTKRGKLNELLISNA